MNITTKTSLVGFLLALSTLTSPAPVTATTPEKNTLEERLTRLTAALRERESQLNNPTEPREKQMARGWADGSGRDWVNGRGRGWADGQGRDWANTRVGGWGDGHGGGWVNGNNWRNGWADRGGFYNHSGGGGFLNRY